LVGTASTFSLGRKGGSLKEERHRQHIRREQAAFLKRIGRDSLHLDLERKGGSLIEERYMQTIRRDQVAFLKRTGGGQPPPSA